MLSNNQILNLLVKSEACVEHQCIQRILSTPDVSTPDVFTPDVSTPDVSTPDVFTPDVSTPDVSTLDWNIISKAPRSMAAACLTGLTPPARAGVILVTVSQAPGDKWGTHHDDILCLTY